MKEKNKNTKVTNKNMKSKNKNVKAKNKNMKEKYEYIEETEEEYYNHFETYEYEYVEEKKRTGFLGWWDKWWIVLAHVVVLVGFIISVVYGHVTYNNSNAATATITNVTSSRRRDSNGHSYTAHTTHVRFQTATGAVYRGTIGGRHGSIDDIITIRYSPRNNNIVRPPGISVYIAPVIVLISLIGSYRLTRDD